MISVAADRSTPASVACVVTRGDYDEVAGCAWLRKSTHLRRSVGKPEAGMDQRETIGRRALLEEGRVHLLGAGNRVEDDQRHPTFPMICAGLRCQASHIGRDIGLPGARRAHRGRLDVLWCVDQPVHAGRFLVFGEVARHAPHGGVGGRVNRAQPLRVQRRRYPQAGSADLRPELAPQPFKLRGGGEPRAHQLHFVEHPLGVVVQQGEVDRPSEPAHGIPAHERAADEHVLSPDDDCGSLRLLVPARLVLAAHEQVYVALRVRQWSVRVRRQVTEAAQPLSRVAVRLVSKRAHREAQYTRRRGTLSGAVARFHSHASTTAAVLPRPVGAMRASGQSRSASACW